MEFLLVNSAKLKVVLSKEDVQIYNIDPSKNECDESCLRARLNEILLLAKSECGFSIGNERVLVQLYPYGEGGAELFVTKLSFMNERERKAISDAPTLATYNEKDVIYCFEDLNTLINAVRTLGDVNIPCDVFRANSGEYYIKFRETIMCGISNLERLSEYGSRASSLPLGINGEYGRRVIKKDGFSILSRL